MSVDSLNNGKRFLEGLIFRTETILGKMVYKLLKTNITLDELVPMINSVLAFVNNWEEKLVDIRQEMLGETDPNKALASSIVSSSSSKSTERKNNEDKKVVPTRPAKLNTPDIRNSKGEFKPKHSESKPIQQFTRDNSSLLEMRHIQEKGPVFEFKEQSLKNYTPKQLGRCVISALGSSTASGRFCMVDRDHGDSVKLMAAMQHSRGTRITKLPPSGEVFGVYLEGSLFRAVRNKVTEGSKGTFIRLLDTGEVFPYEKDNQRVVICTLSEYYRNLPSFAIRCVLVKILDDPYCADFSEFLEKNLHNTLYYKVASVEGSLLFMKLSQHKISPKLPMASVTRDSTSSNESTELLMRSKSVASPSRMNLFIPEPVDQLINGGNIRFPTVLPTDFNKDNPFSEASLYKDLRLPSKFSLDCNGLNGHGGDEDSDGAESAECEAVEGVIPPIGTKIFVIPKFVQDVELIWCHVVPPDFISNDLIEMELMMNAPEVSSKLKTLDKCPEIGALVFATFGDKRYYRAEVTEVLGRDRIWLFYVDYGNVELVRLQDIREWDPRFGYLPHQAVPCRVANVERIRPHHTQAVAELNRKILNKRIEVVVVNNTTPWEIQLLDKDGFDMAQGLILAKLAKPRVPKRNFEDSMEEQLIKSKESP
ncbi:uncharacterized protein LOC129760226 isoform X1 [Uranotaenia lowii]|uniref:uncharacterized protein LOC129760226 isoform X1 n=1 Tax=Uranotaenia lowii TaxID=190385 RepID=UPI00247961B2|nr:uncharacterized protein LOC129760226 isoform X1 [Uranotaenia lowii]